MRLVKPFRTFIKSDGNLMLKLTETAKFLNLTTRAIETLEAGIDFPFKPFGLPVKKEAKKDPYSLVDLLLRKKDTGEMFYILDFCSGGRENDYVELFELFNLQTNEEIEIEKENFKHNDYDFFEYKEGYSLEELEEAEIKGDF